MIRIRPIKTIEVIGNTHDINHYNETLMYGDDKYFRVDDDEEILICTVCHKTVSKSDSISNRGKSLICCACQARLENILGVSYSTLLHLVHRDPCTIEINKCEQNMNKKDIDTGYQE